MKFTVVFPLLLWLTASQCLPGQTKTSEPWGTNYKALLSYTTDGVLDDEEVGPGTYIRDGYQAEVTAASVKCYVPADGNLTSASILFERFSSTDPDKISSTRLDIPVIKTGMFKGRAVWIGTFAGRITGGFIAAAQVTSGGGYLTAFTIRVSGEGPTGQQVDCAASLLGVQFKPQVD